MPRNFNERKEREAQDGSEWRYGAIAEDIAAIPVGKREKYLPTGVLQYNASFDTNGCASRGPLNVLECKLDWLYDNGMHPAIKQWCDANGYRANGKFALADAFIEILSGTQKDGNSLKAPVDAMSNYGVIPASMMEPIDNFKSWDDYMNPKRITSAHKRMGKEFLRRLTFNYEQVPLSQFPEAMNDDLLDIALHAWPQPVNGVYPKTEGGFNHVVAVYTPRIDIFDNYNPFMKRLAKDYLFFEWAYSFSITAQNPYPDETMTLFEILQKNGLLAFFNEALARLFAS